jgi:hypothetical protein
MVKFSCEALALKSKDSSMYAAVKKIKSIFRKINYGLRDPKTNKPWRDTHKSTTIDDYDEYWRLGTPEQTIKAGIGNCYDTVAISREYLSNLGCVSVYFMTLADSVFDGKHFTEAPTHTFLIYEHDGEWKWLEGSWGPFKNNDWHSKSKSDIVKRIATAMANMEKKQIVVHSLSGYPRYGCDMTEFERFCRKGTKVGTYRPEKGTDK